jgi:hypothetical protein
MARDDVEAIRLMIHKETRYMRHYPAQVVSTDDQKKAGRVQATVPLLGWKTQDQASWFWPRDKHGMVVPKVGEWIEVYFMAGDPNHPVYLGNASELQGQTPAAFDGAQTTVVLWQDPQTGDSIVYDATIPEIRILGKGDNLVTYSALATAMTNLVNIFNAHTHITTCPAGAGSAAATLTPMSADISSAKAKRLKTDG